MNNFTSALQIKKKPATFIDEEKKTKAKKSIKAASKTSYLTP